MQQPDLTHLIQLAQSPAGKQLLELLQKNSNDLLQTAASQASTGDYLQASKTLAPILEQPEVKKIIQQLGGNP